MSNGRELSQLAPLVTVDANNKITFVSTSEVEFGGLAFPTTDGTNGQVLTTDGAGNLTFTTASGGGSSVGTYNFNITASTTNFNTSADTYEKVQVYVNGAFLDDDDFTFTASTGVVSLSEAVDNGEVVSIWAYSSAGVTYTNSDVDAHLNSSTATNGEVLSWNGTDYDWVAAGGGVSNVVEDTTPQLGGNLDVNDNLIYNDTGTVKLQAGSADYVTIVNSAGADRIRFSDIGGIAALGWYHQFGDSSATRGLVNIMGSDQGFDPGSGTLKIFDGDSSASVTLTVPTTLSGNVLLTLPGADGSNGQVLTTDGSGNLSFADASGGIADIVEDTSPQLGGNLDLNNFTIGNLTGATPGRVTTIKGGVGLSDDFGYAYGGKVVIESPLATDGFFANFRGDIELYGDKIKTEAFSVSVVGANTEGRLRLLEDPQNGTSYVELKSPASLSGNVNLTLPSSDGSNGQVLTTDGSGNLSFADQNVEVLDPKTSATGTVTHDLNTAAVFRHTSISANFTANFTNVDTTNDRTTSVVLILVQGGTAYMPTAVQIGGSAQTILWQGGSAPSGTASGTDVVSFTLIRSGSTWSVIGSATSYS